MLNITLTEPTVFLRSSDPSGRLQLDPNDPHILVRGILTLNVVKPILVSSIDVELVGQLMVSYPESVTARHANPPEKHKIYSSTVTVFRADQVPYGKRPASVGPGLLTASSNNDNVYVPTTLPRPSSLGRGRSELRLRGVSAPHDLGPTPPYSPVALSPTSIQSRIFASGDSPTQILEELRQVNSEACENGLSPSLSSRHLSLPPPPKLRTRYEAFRREHDNHVPTNLPVTGDTSPQEPLNMLPHRDCSPGGLSRSSSPGNRHGSNCEASSTLTGRSRWRLSLSAVLDTVMDITSRAPPRARTLVRLEERERGRTRVRESAQEQRRGNVQMGEGIAGAEDSSQLGAKTSHSSDHLEHIEHHLRSLSRVFGLERDCEKNAQKFKEGWKEFKPGTYSYAISFLLPPDLPPTFSVPRASLCYTIKGIAHRPGTFTSKLSCRVPLLIVATPAAGAGEGTVPGDPGPLFFQRQWEGRLAYSFGLGSRLLLLGSQHHLEVATSNNIRASAGSLVEAEVEARAAYGTATLDLVLLPLEKVKLWRLSIFIDQQIKYLDGKTRLCRDEIRNRMKLLEVQDMCSAEELDLADEELTHKNKHKTKHGNAPIPLLPTPLSPHRSPLLQYVPPSTDPSILAGPGPYTLSISIGLPDCNDPSGSSRGLHFTVKQKGSFIRVEHSLQLVMRVEKIGDEGSDGHEDGEKKFDITIQTPITILSPYCSKCRCMPEYQTLPRYSPNDDLSDRAAVCPCQPAVTMSNGPVEYVGEHEDEDSLEHIMTPSARPSFETDDTAMHLRRHQLDELHNVYIHAHVRPRSRSPSRARSPSPSCTGVDQSGRESPVQRCSRQHCQTCSQSTTACVRSRSQVQTPVSTPRTSRPPSPLARYERLVSGLESEAGEAPPSYDSIAPRC